MKEKWQRYLTKEIGIEFKACMYFYIVLFFYSIFRLISEEYTAEILIMAEMIFVNYTISYVQVYFFHNFDEADRLGVREGLSILVCSGCYAVISYVLNWFERRMLITGIFAAYMIFSYVCMFLVYKIKRDIDTKQLNHMLADFKEHRN
jgi:hypothetical protein